METLTIQKTLKKIKIIERQLKNLKKDLENDLKLPHVKKVDPKSVQGIFSDMDWEIPKRKLNKAWKTWRTKK
jgi:hypothetical protein